MKLEKHAIDALAPNANAIKNGEALWKKKSFVALHQNPEGTVLFGECAGSGQKNYQVSADFGSGLPPVCRCNCPSRQFPCKHALGLMYAYAAATHSFEVSELPADLTQKRQKAEDRQKKQSEKKAEDRRKPPTKAQITKQQKKIDQQLEGIALAEKMLSAMLDGGLSALGTQQGANYTEQVQQLGNYYINGIQAAFQDIILQNNRQNGEPNAVRSLIYLYALLKKSREYLTKKRQDPVNNVEWEQDLEERIGYAWKLDELIDQQKCEKNSELIQLAFYPYPDEAARQWVEEGYYYSLQSGRLYKNRNLRPFRAATHIKEEDSLFAVIQAEEVAIYPGHPNPRARWKTYTQRELKDEDYQHIHAHARTNYAELAKEIKNQLKSPLTDAYPVALVRFVREQMQQGQQHFMLADAEGTVITLGDVPLISEPFHAGFGQVMACLPPHDLTALLLFAFDADKQLLLARPLSIITDRQIIRLLY